MIKRKTLNNPEGKLDELAIPFGDEILNIKYNSGEVTPKLEREAEALRKEGTIGTMFSTLLARILKEWDVVDVHPDDVNKPESKQRYVPLPLTAEALDEVIGIGASVKIWLAIQEKSSPNETTSPPIESTFDPEE